MSFRVQLKDACTTFMLRVVKYQKRKEWVQGTGELCSIIIVVSRPTNVVIVSAFACRNATS